MISGASEQELDIANARAELLLEIKDKDKEIERLKAIIDKAKQYVKTCKDNDMGIRYQTIEEILREGERYERRNNTITREK